MNALTVAMYEEMKAVLESVEKLAPRARVVTDNSLEQAADDLAHRIARHSPVEIRFAKRSLTTIEYLDLNSGYEFEQGVTGELSAYDDAKKPSGRSSSEGRPNTRVDNSRRPRQCSARPPALLSVSATGGRTRGCRARQPLVPRRQRSAHPSATR
ncbi:hypothetical protein [Streptomyces sp. NPDC051219]|uniref:hypothetical protein n=1 Tax=Streptomyces sp. NPDC051219 TaxID=3155283 RepID=UPI003416BBD7